MTGDIGVWGQQVADALNAIPKMSYTSFVTPNSQVTGGTGEMLVNLASVTTIPRLWLKEVGSGNTGWASFLTSGGALEGVLSSQTTVTASWGSFGTMLSSFLSASTATLRSLVLQDGAWDDVNLPIASAKVPAAGAPSWASFSGALNAYTFAVGNFVDLQAAELPHGYKAGTYLEAHVHVVSNTSEAPETNARYQLDYTVANLLGVIRPVSALTGAQVIPSATTDRTFYRVSCGTIDGTGLTYGAFIGGRVSRVAKASGADPATDPFMVQVGFHYQREALGAGSF